MDDRERLRDAFAQLIAAGQGRALPMEALWAGQGQRQLPPAAAAAAITSPQMNQGETTLRMPQVPTPDPNLNFPTADAELYSAPAVEDARAKAKPPFPGADSVEVKPYDLPKKKKKAKKDG